ncbi:MAG: hypothetical protein ACO1PB_04640 [Ramlibacter sp.]
MPSAPKLATDQFEHVTIRGKKFSMLEVHQRLAALPPHTPLSTQEAGFFLGYSVSQMERMRIAGTGPRYRQTPPEPGSKAVNMHCIYKKADLVEWDRQNTAGSANEHAAIHGRMFATLAEVVEELPFYVDESGEVESLAEENAIETVIERLGSWRIVWMPAAEACALPWRNLAAHRELASKVLGALSQAKGAIEAGVETSEIRSVLPERKEPPKRDRGL